MEGVEGGRETERKERKVVSLGWDLLATSTSYDNIWDGVSALCQGKVRYLRGKYVISGGMHS